jgi:Ca-activated chloride channel family protein
MKTKQKVALVFLLAAAINGAALFSFDQKNNQEKSKEGLDYQISVSAISIAVTVQDKGGRYIDNLTEGDFTIYENNVKQAITYFKHDFTTPLSLTVLLDVSGSMAIQDKLKESKEALNDLLTNLLGPNDEASLLIFADGEVEVAADFSTDKKKFLIELEKAEAYGQTALYDAVAVSPEFANKGKKEKRGLLLITDGIENDSQCTPEQAVEIARRVDVPIYTIGYKIPLNEQYLRKYKSRSDMSSAGIMATLERFSRATGGKAFFLNGSHELTAALREIKRELSHQYILGYTSYKTSKNEYRRIRVVTRDRKHRVRTREGY